MKLLAWIAIWVLCVICAAVALSIMPLMAALGVKRAHRMAIGFDQVGNAMTGGSEDETITERAARLRRERRWACLLCSLLDFVDPGHCDR